MQLPITTVLYLGTVVTLATAAFMIWLGARSMAAEKRRLLAERIQADVESRVQDILNREAQSIEASRHRKTELSQDMRAYYMKAWISDLLRARDVFVSRHWS